MNINQLKIPLLFLLLLVAGCHTTKDELLPPGESTMLDLWQQNASPNTTINDTRSSLRRSLTEPEQAQQQITTTNYSRTAETEIQQQFPRLPNPDMVMYVYPHMTENSAPVPGYSTVFPFYTTVQYALPGERTEAL